MHILPKKNTLSNDSDRRSSWSIVYELKTATDTQVSSQVKLRYNKVNNALNLPTALFLFLRRNKINFKIEFTFVSDTSDGTVGL